MASITALLDPLKKLLPWSHFAPPKGSSRGSKLGDDPGIDRSVNESIEWLLRAQDFSTTSDGGVARHFSLVAGWGPSYPETTGYILPTIIRFANGKAEDRRRPAGNGASAIGLDGAPSAGEKREWTAAATLKQRAQSMLDWLIEVQLPNGAFQGGTVVQRPVVPVVFNTGQVLLGLAAAASEFDSRYLDVMHRSASWLLEVQDPDGCWRKHESPFAGRGERAYDAHVAWGLFEAARVSGEAAYAEAAARNLYWAVGKQRPNGWFADCCLSDPAQPLTHTLGYAARGMIEGYRYTGEPIFRRAAERAGHGLLGALRADGFIAGRLNADWKGTVSWACLTGTSQLAHCWLLLFQETGHAPFLDAARAANEYVRRTVDVDGPPETRGAVGGSFPISGAYGAYQYPNWAAKFFIDSNLLEEEVSGSTV